MPKIPESAAFDAASKIQKELNFNLTVGTGDPLVGTGASLVKSVSIQEVRQNEVGLWTETIFDKESPVKDQNETINNDKNDRNSVIRSYEEIASVFDVEILDYNTQINQKKSEIISTLYSAVSVGCSFIPRKDEDDIRRSIIDLFTKVSNPLNINGVACGVDKLITSDKSIVLIYKNLTNYSADTIFTPILNEDITNLNLGKGFENQNLNNAGSSLGEYLGDLSGKKVVSEGPPPVLQDDSFCIECRDKILSLATEIADLRVKRDQYLKEVNNLKDLKSGEEVVRWGNNQAEFGINSYNENLRSAIDSLSKFTGDIVTEGLIVHFTTLDDYSIQTETDSETGINAVTSWYNLGGDSLYAIPQTSLYPINLDINDGPSVEINNYVTQTNQYFEVENSYVGVGKIEAGDASYSIEIWTKITKDSNLGISSTSNGASIVGINSVHGYGLQVYKPAGVRVSFGERGNGSLVNNTDLNTNTWYHIVATNESGVGSKIYINGVLDGSGSQINITSTTNNLTFGYSPEKISQYFSGKISIIRIYKKNLTESDVLQNFNAHKSRYGY